MIVPKDNVKEASLVQGVNIFGFDTLREVVYYLEGKREYNVTLEEVEHSSEP